MTPAEIKAALNQGIGYLDQVPPTDVRDKWQTLDPIKVQNALEVAALALAELSEQQGVVEKSIDDSREQGGNAMQSFTKALMGSEKVEAVQTIGATGEFNTINAGQKERLEKIAVILGQATELVDELGDLFTMYTDEYEPGYRRSTEAVQQHTAAQNAAAYYRDNIIT
jgi:hypothetical protein